MTFKQMDNSNLTIRETNKDFILTLPTIVMTGLLEAIFSRHNNVTYFLSKQHSYAYEADDIYARNK